MFMNPNGNPQTMKLPAKYPKKYMDKEYAILENLGNPFLCIFDSKLQAREVLVM
jgi:hypothetical protein